MAKHPLERQGGQPRQPRQHEGPRYLEPIIYLDEGRRPVRADRTPVGLTMVLMPANVVSRTCFPLCPETSGGVLHLGCG